MEIVETYYQGRLLLVNGTVAALLQITQGHIIQTETEFWKIFDASLAHCMLVCGSAAEPKN